jgi:hypothetical protein
MSRARPTDTSAAADSVQLELLREMSPAARAERMTALTLAVQRLALAGMRRRHPLASEDELWLRLAAQRLGPEVVRKVYGFDAEQS